MNIELIVIGKTDSKEITALVEMYTKRINFYNRFTITYIPDIRQQIAHRGTAENCRGRGNSKAH